MMFSSNIVLAISAEKSFSPRWLFSKVGEILLSQIGKTEAGLDVKRLQRHLNWTVTAMESLKRSQGDTWDL